MAKKKPGRSKKARKKATGKSARAKRSAKKAKARKKPAKKKAKTTRTAKKKTTARKAASRKTKKKVKKTTGAKTKTAAKKTSKAASSSAAPARSKKKAGATAKGAKVSKSQSKKGAAKKAAPTGPVPDAQGYVVINGRRVRMISTKGLIIPKRSTTKAAADKEVENDKPKKPRKSRLTPKDLDYYRELLLLRRRQLAGDLTSMETEALRSSGGDVSHMPIHMADIGSDTFDQDFMLGLAANERVLLKEIDEALSRIESGEYGICALTGNPIPKSRLNAKPWAKYTVEAARMIERGLSA